MDDEVLEQAIVEMIQRGQSVSRLDLEQELVGVTHGGDTVKEKVILYIVASHKMDKAFIEAIEKAGMHQDKGESAN